MYRIFINGGGSSPYDLIAQKAGWKLGINSGGKNSHRTQVFMVDNNWRHYNHTQHLMAVNHHRPNMATVRDIESHVDQKETLKQIREINQFCQKIVIIPKCRLIPEVLDFPNLIFGLPLGPEENSISWDYALNSNFAIHLLGGSPKRWVSAIERLGNRIHSFDGNYLSKIAKWGKIYKNFRSRSPHQWEVPSGKNFNYRCFEYSLQCLDSMIFNHQLTFNLKGDSDG